MHSTFSISTSTYKHSKLMLTPQVSFCHLPNFVLSSKMQPRKVILSQFLITSPKWLKGSNSSEATSYFTLTGLSKTGWSLSKNYYNSQKIENQGFLSLKFKYSMKELISESTSSVLIPPAVLKMWYNSISPGLSY